MVLIPLLSLIFGIFEFSRLLMDWNLLNNAAREGCRYAVVNNTSTTISTDVQTTVTNFMAGQTTAFSNFTVTVSGTHQGVATPVNNLTAGDLVTVTVSGTYKFHEHYSLGQDAHVLLHHQLGHHGVRGRRLGSRSDRRSIGGRPDRQFCCRGQTMMRRNNTRPAAASSPSRDRPAAGRTRDRGHGRVPGAGDRPGNAGDRQDAGATVGGPCRAHRDAHAEWKREHQLQPECGHDQRAECRDLQRDPGADSSVVATSSSPSARTTTTRPPRPFRPISRRRPARRRPRSRQRSPPTACPARSARS